MITCNHCGKNLPEGSLRYVVDITICADYDGFIDEEEDNIEDKIEEILDSLDDKDAKILEEDVYQELSLILCKSCKDRLRKNFIPHSGFSLVDLEGRKSTLH